MWIKDIRDYILYEDREILVCHKPAGIAVQNARQYGYGEPLEELYCSEGSG